jgi:hypothetical protein
MPLFALHDRTTTRRFQHKLQVVPFESALFVQMLSTARRENTLEVLQLIRLDNALDQSFTQTSFAVLLRNYDVCDPVDCSHVRDSSPKTDKRFSMIHAIA